MGEVRIVAAVLAAAFAPASMHALERSRALWATVDVCSPADQPHTIGVRGSMPGDGHPKDQMYMRFRVQYQDPTSKRWLFVARGADSGLLRVGGANLARQAGRSFQFAPNGKRSYALRGYVTFQWRRAASVLGTVAKVTVAGHTSIAGADPKNYSAATCRLS
ncbi:MAG TPA: hypothetical protein VHU13_03945 [Solirubrobacteraceae bacterium]|nr:hypothetical protein [Solirubrobacteraceae bacterium]